MLLDYFTFYIARTSSRSVFRPWIPCACRPMEITFQRRTWENSVIISNGTCACMYGIHILTHAAERLCCRKTGYTHARYTHARFQITPFPHRLLSGCRFLSYTSHLWRPHIVMWAHQTSNQAREEKDREKKKRAIGRKKSNHREQNNEITKHHLHFHQIHIPFSCIMKTSFILEFYTFHHLSLLAGYRHGATSGILYRYAHPHHAQQCVQIILHRSSPWKCRPYARHHSSDPHDSYPACICCI